MATGIALFETAIGPCGIAWGDSGICGVQLPETTETATRSRLARTHPGASVQEPPPDIEVAITRITALLAGEPDDLHDVDVDLHAVPEFNRRVYDLARAVGPGQTTTYGEIATELGAPLAAREVGQALGRNPVPLIVPCHRVLAAGGKVGGFSAQGGVTTKLRLLDIEGAAPNGQPSLFG
ncbi:MAG TPA: methylated-DNA--[protein]-cysteine S-methyltransferase [Mycobacteriales bacterium]|jgi:methylated-DNA-[protein]-cysteine S-methyltransferase|nr:methylated-DNA--[protein]-cysteine S-methyltransferase [Mycobacteriales bacterium]